MLLDRAKNWARQIIECSPDAIQASKQVVQLSLAEPSVVDAISKQGNYVHVRDMRMGENIVEGTTAFAQKRQPQWKSPKSSL